MREAIKRALIEKHVIENYRSPLRSRAKGRSWAVRQMLLDKHDINQETRQYHDRTHLYIEGPGPTARINTKPGNLDFIRTSNLLGGETLLLLDIP